MPRLVNVAELLKDFSRKSRKDRTEAVKKLEQVRFLSKTAPPPFGFHPYVADTETRCETRNNPYRQTDNIV